MAYATLDDMRRLLPETITIGNTNLGTPQPGRQAPDRDMIGEAKAYYYLDYAQQYIDGRLRPFYVVPVRRVKSFETLLLSNASTGSDVTITVHDSGPFIQGTTVRIQDSNGVMDTTTISSVTSLQQFVVSSLSYSYVSQEAKVSVLEYPDPIPIMTTRLAIAAAFDELFSAEQSPNVSQYGKTQRNMARDDMDSILSGETILFGQNHTGRRFIRMSLLDQWGTPHADYQKGAEQES